jgi:hypothetical protein
VTSFPTYSSTQDSSSSNVQSSDQSSTQPTQTTINTNESDESKDELEEDEDDNDGIGGAVIAAIVIPILIVVAMFILFVTVLVRRLNPFFWFFLLFIGRALLLTAIFQENPESRGQNLDLMKNLDLKARAKRGRRKMDREAVLMNQDLAAKNLRVDLAKNLVVGLAKAFLELTYFIRFRRVQLIYY